MAIEEHAVFFHYNFYQQFIKDLNEARGLVLLQSPYLTMWRIDFLRPALQACIKRGVRVCVFAQQPDPKYPDCADKVASLMPALEVLACMGIHVNMRLKKHEKIAIIDEELLWEGTLNALSYRDTSERINRWVSRRMVRDAMLEHGLNQCQECPSYFLNNEKESHALMRLGNAIAGRRRHLGLSQIELAGRIGIQPSFLSRIETGHKAAAMQTLIKIVAELELDLVAIPRYMRAKVENDVQRGP